ncbi:MAG: DUF1080 domain-containing protein [Pirellulales bacterium]
MLRTFWKSAVVGCLTISAVATAAEKAAPQTAATPIELKTLLDEPLDVKHGTAWRVAKGRWEFVDGAWQGAELAADKHGAVARHDVSFTDAVIEFDFKLDGARSISLSINDPQGHNSRLAISPSEARLTKDDHDHKGPDKAEVLATLATKFEPGTWYHVKVVQHGENFNAVIGERKIDHELQGKHGAINVKKSNIGLTVAGESASFRKLRIKELPAGQAASKN